MPFSSLSNCTSHNAMLLPDLPVTTERERASEAEGPPTLASGSQTSGSTRCLGSTYCNGRWGNRSRRIGCLLCLTLASFGPHWWSIGRREIIHWPAHVHLVNMASFLRYKIHLLSFQRFPWKIYLCWYVYENTAAKVLRHLPPCSCKYPSKADYYTLWKINCADH